MPYRALAWTVLLGAAFAAVVSARGAGSATQIVFAADRRPALDGEIYRVDMDGKRVDLSRSPYADTQQTVSPNGKRVAFLSVRSGSSRIYVAGTDGRGLTPVSAGLPTLRPPQILGWSPDSTRVAVIAVTARESRIYILQPRRPQRVIAHVSAADGGIGGGAWSPDSQEFEFDSPYQSEPVVRVVGATGRPAFTVNGDAPAWSARGRLAVVSDERVRVLSEHGKRLIVFPGRAFAWSPHGDRLASLTGQTLTVHGAGGTGRVIFTKKASGTAQLLFWADARRVVLVTRLDDEKYDGIDVSNGRTWKPSQRLVSAHYCGCTSPDGSLVADTTRVGDGFALRVARLNESHARTLIRVPSCMDDGGLVPAVESVQFATARSVVYQSSCAEPPVDVYSVDPGGGTARELTRTAAEETEPALSPDGTQVAYVRADARGLSCKGCPATIWIMSSDGTNQHALTQPQNGQWDYDPSWSPDGTQIVFSRWYSAGVRPDHLFVVAAAGGAARDLGVVGASPAWGPDAIAYVEEGTPVDGGSLWSVAPDGTGRRQLAGGETAYLPAWSRGGELAYVDQTLGRNAVLVVSGRGVPLAVARVDDLAWLSDGSRLVLFAAKVNTGSLGSLVYDVYTVRPDGSGLQRLTTNVSGWPR